MGRVTYLSGESLVRHHYGGWPAMTGDQWDKSTTTNASQAKSGLRQKSPTSQSEAGLVAPRRKFALLHVCTSRSQHKVQKEKIGLSVAWKTTAIVPHPPFP